MALPSLTRRSPHLSSHGIDADNLLPLRAFSLCLSSTSPAPSLSLSHSLPLRRWIPFTISRFLRPSPSRHSALRLSEERRKNSSGRWPPPASHRFIPLSHSALFSDRPPRINRGYRGSPRHDHTGSLTATPRRATTMTTRNDDDTTDDGDNDDKRRETRHNE